MPWDDTELWVADLDGEAQVSHVATAGAARPGESVQQPRWSPDGVLHWVSDRSGWWNLYADGEPLCPMAAEFGEPGWVFGTSTYAFTADGRLVAAWSGPDGCAASGVIDGGRATRVGPAVRRLHVAGGDRRRRRAASPRRRRLPRRSSGSPAGRPPTGSCAPAGRSRLDPGFLSEPQRLRVPDRRRRARVGAVLPAGQRHPRKGPAGERPPLVVMSHGGPTVGGPLGARPRAAVLDQPGLCRRRRRLPGQHRLRPGVPQPAAGRLGRLRRRGLRGGGPLAGRAGPGRPGPLRHPGRQRRRVHDPGGAGVHRRLRSRGPATTAWPTSAALARDTHKFESRYLDRMVGPWPEADDTYRARSPIHHLDGFDRPLILFQGLEDAIVPPAQSEMIYEALRAKGMPVAYLAFEGEQHGFRRAETIRTVAISRAQLLRPGPRLRAPRGGRHRHRQPAADRALMPDTGPMGKGVGGGTPVRVDRPSRMATDALRQ